MNDARRRHEANVPRLGRQQADKVDRPDNVSILGLPDGSQFTTRSLLRQFVNPCLDVRTHPRIDLRPSDVRQSTTGSSGRPRSCDDKGSFMMRILELPLTGSTHMAGAMIAAGTLGFLNFVAWRLNNYPTNRHRHLRLGDATKYLTSLGPIAWMSNLRTNYGKFLGSKPS